jgi:sugar transferase (PEP-CTERM/EpsH1 system associated)
MQGKLETEGYRAGVPLCQPVPHSEPRHHGRVLKVMHVVNSMSLGGTEKAVLKLATRLAAGFEHRICCIRGFDAALTQSCLRPEQVVALNLRSSRLSFFVPPLLRAIRAYRPDIVHSRNWGAIEAVLAARLAAVPVVIHSEHGYEIESLSRTPVRQQWMRRLVCSVADAVFTVSGELRGFHAAQAGIRPDRIRVLWNGVDTQAFAPARQARTQMRSQLGISSGDFVIGAVGRMVPIKDYATLIQAAGRLAEAGSNFKLILVGDGPELPRLRELAQSLSGVGSHFLALGRRDDIPALLAGMDVFVQTSLGEGMSNTVLEAMASGLPVVVTRVGGNPEIVTHGCGWLFEPGDVQHLSQLLLMLAADRDFCRRAGQAARSRVEEAFSHSTMLENYRRLYLELASKKQLLETWNWAEVGLPSRGVSGT